MLTIARPVSNPLSETALRKRATRRGLRVVKGRAVHDGGFMLCDRRNGAVIAGHEFSLRLEDLHPLIEAYRPV